MGVMGDYLDSRERVANWLKRLGNDAVLYYPQRTGSASYAFEPLIDNSSVDFDHYLPTITPPGKRLAPDGETLFTFSRGDDGRYRFKPAPAPLGQILAGVRHCDLMGVAEMDRVNSDGPVDPLYRQRRAVTTIIAQSCLQPCDERCFCAATGSLDYQDGADINLTPVEGGLLLQSLTEAGEALLESSGLGETRAAASLYSAALATRPTPFGRQLKASPEELPAILRDRYDSTLYAEYAKRCFSCGTCNLVCPTCYCFEVEDDLNLDTVSGVRTRTWDACMNHSFAEVAGNHNFRGEAADRQRHRVKRKFEYLPERFAMGSFCTGCGRCGRQCTTAIDIYDIVNDLADEYEQERGV